jgi:CHU_C Type IX secretion signal domain
MIKRIPYICFVLLLPILVNGVQIQPEAGSVEGGLLQAGDPIVLSFDRLVNDVKMNDVVSARSLSGEKLPITIQTVGSSIIVRPVSSWPVSQDVVLEIGSDLPLSGRSYSGSPSLTFHVQGDGWDNLDLPANKTPGRETKSDGYLENGVEVYPLPITPNGDGVNDELHVGRPGIGFKNPYIRIFSPDGVRVMSIARSGLRNGEVIWDGVDRLGHEVRPGPYFIIVEEDSEIIASGVIYVLR